MIRSNGSANLFLINPAGIIFGENARLDIGGSFYSSTADSILFEDGEFNTNLNEPPVLTVNAPIGLSFRNEPGDIVVRGNGKGTRLTGSEIIDTQDALRVGENATISIGGGNLIFDENSNSNAGNIGITTNSFESNNGLLSAVHSGTGNAGNISLDVSENIALNNDSSINASGTDGSSGEIEIAAGSLAINNSLSALFAASLSQGMGGNITIDAANEVSLANTSGINVTGSPGGSANVNTRNLSLTSGSYLFAGAGPDSEASDVASGDVVINLSKDLVLVLMEM